MAVIEGGVSGSLAGVGVETGSAQHVTSKPTPYGSLGHYRTSHRCALVNTQAANSRLFELQNASATNLIIIDALRIFWMQTANHTAAIEDSLDKYKCTSFTVVDTTNTVTPVISKMRSSMPSAGAVVRGLTVAGNSAGMTGGTLTKDTNPLKQVPMWLLAAIPTAGPPPQQILDYVHQPVNGEHPLVLVQNEGFIIENRVLLGAAAGSAFYIDVEWTEATAY